MSWHSVLTERGASLLAASIGTSFYLTKISLGCGITTEDLTKQTSLLNEKATATSVKIYNSGNSSNVTFELKNKVINEEFELQQIGIWAKQNESDDDILYMIIQDDSEKPTTIKSAIDSPGYTYAATINIVVGNSNIINATATEAGTVKYDEVFDKNGMYIGSKLKNTIVSFVGADNLIEIESTDNISTIFGKIKKSIKDLIFHLTNKKNPHEVTVNQIGAAAASHKHAISDVNGLTVEDISTDFIVGTSGAMQATYVDVRKQGNVISGSMYILIDADGPGDVECYLTINDKYKLQNSVYYPLLASSNLRNYITINGSKIDYGDTNLTKGSAQLSFTYICE